MVVAQHEQGLKQRKELQDRLQAEEMSQLRGSPEILERSRRIAEKKVVSCLSLFISRGRCSVWWCRTELN